jgi:hypothetical protein
MRRGADLIGHRRRFVTAAQNSVVQVGRMGFSGIKRYNNPLTFCIYPDVAHSRDAHERFSQFADAFIAILAFRRDRDSLQHRFVCALQGMRVSWIEMMRIEWFDHRFNLHAAVRRRLCRRMRSTGTLPQQPASLPASARTPPSFVAGIVDPGRIAYNRMESGITDTGYNKSGRKEIYFAATSRAIGSSTRQTFSTRTLCPAAFG